MLSESVSKGCLIHSPFVNYDWKAPLCPHSSAKPDQREQLQCGKDVRPVEGDQGKGLSLSLSLEHEATRGTGGLMEHSNSCLGS